MSRPFRADHSSCDRLLSSFSPRDERSTRRGPRRASVLKLGMALEALLVASLGWAPKAYADCPVSLQSIVLDPAQIVGASNQVATVKVLLNDPCHIGVRPIFGPFGTGTTISVSADLNGFFFYTGSAADFTGQGFAVAPPLRVDFFVLVPTSVIVTAQLSTFGRVGGEILLGPPVTTQLTILPLSASLSLDRTTVTVGEPGSITAMLRLNFNTGPSGFAVDLVPSHTVFDNGDSTCREPGDFFAGFHLVVFVPPGQSSGSCSFRMIGNTAQPIRVTLTAFACADFSRFPPFRIRCPVASATITVLPRASQQKFRLKVRETDGGSRSENVDFEAKSSELMLDQRRYKLGQSFSAQVVPLQPNGSEGAPLMVQEKISNVIPNNPILSMISNTAITLFDGNVLLHFPTDSMENLHEFFGVHSGQATIDLRFLANSNSFTLHVPIRIVNCAFDRFVLACDPRLGSTHPDFDTQIMIFADRSGIPPQLVKAHVAQESGSGFDPKAYRYEPLSYDFGRINFTFVRGVRQPSNQLLDKRLAPWRFGVSSNCKRVTLPQGTSLDPKSLDASKREGFDIQLNKASVPLCQVSDVGQGSSTRLINSNDSLISMQNIYFTNKTANNWYPRSGDFADKFDDYVDGGNQPFTAQTVIAASYGLLQVMYPTAVQVQGFTERFLGGIGRPPSELFRPVIALDLGTCYLSSIYDDLQAPQDQDFNSRDQLMFQFGPPLQLYNAGPGARDNKDNFFTFDEIFAKCGPGHHLAPPPPKGTKDPDKRFRYACAVLNNASKYTPAALKPTNGGSQ